MSYNYSSVSFSCSDHVQFTKLLFNVQQKVDRDVAVPSLRLTARGWCNLDCNARKLLVIPLWCALLIAS